MEAINVVFLHSIRFLIIASTDCITIKESCLEIKSVPQSEYSLQKKPCLDYDPTEHPEEPHPPINSKEVKHETKISKSVSSPCAQSSNWLPIGKPLKRWVYFNVSYSQRGHYKKYVIEF